MVCRPPSMQGNREPAVPVGETRPGCRKVDELSRGFIYMVSNASITGAKNDITAAQVDYFKRVSAMKLENPRLIGFGISNHQTFSTACQYANGAIIGSAFIKALSKNGTLDEIIPLFVQMVRGENVNV